MNAKKILIATMMIIIATATAFSYTDNYDMVYLKQGFLVQKIPSSTYGTWLDYVLYPSKHNISNSYMMRMHTDIFLHNETKTIEQMFPRANLGIVLVKVKPNTIADRNSTTIISCARFPYSMTKENTTSWQWNVTLNESDYTDDGFAFVEINPYYSKTLTSNGEMGFWCDFKTNASIDFQIDEMYFYDSSFWYRLVGAKPFCDYENKYIIDANETTEFCNKQVSMSAFTKFNQIFANFQELLLTIFVYLFKIFSIILMIFVFILLPIWIMMKIKQYIDKTFSKRR